MKTEDLARYEAEQNAKDELENVFDAMYPGFEIKFADGVLDGVGDLADLTRAINKMDRRLRSRWFGWFWQWYYRPRPLDE